MLKKILATLIFIAAAAASGYAILLKRSHPIFYKGASVPTTDPTKPKILLVCLSIGMGGGENHILALYKKLYANGYDASLLINENSALEAQLKDLGLPFYTTCANHFSGIARPLYHLALQATLSALCKTKQFDIIHTNNRPETPDALSLKKSHPVRVVLTQHVPTFKHFSDLRGLDELVVVGPRMVEMAQNANIQNHFSIPMISWIPPLLSIEKFLTFTPQESREAFFHEIIKQDLKPYPVICMIANFYGDLDHKNHVLMIRAVKQLVDKQKPVYVVFAGDGSSRPAMEKMATELGLEEYIHFLGFYKNTPALLHHSDMMVLTSKNEALGIVYLEAGLMKKSAIGASGTGAEAVLINEKTGLLFKNNDLDDLVAQIERLIDSPDFARRLGQNAYQHVMQNFSPDVVFKQYQKLYERLGSIN